MCHLFPRLGINVPWPTLRACRPQFQKCGLQIRNANGFLPTCSFHPALCHGSSVWTFYQVEWGIFSVGHHQSPLHKANKTPCTANGDPLQTDMSGIEKYGRQQTGKTPGSLVGLWDFRTRKAYDLRSQFLKFSRHRLAASMGHRATEWLSEELGS